MAASRSSPSSNSSSTLILIAGIVIVGVLVVLLLGRVPRSDPFRMSSTAPDGYGALSMLLERHDVENRDVAPSIFFEEFTELDYESVALILPRERFLHDHNYEDLLDHVAAGATLVIGDAATSSNPYAEDEWSDDWMYSDFWSDEISPQSLIDAEQSPVAVGHCTIERLADLGDIDAYGSDLFITDDTELGCYGDGSWYLISEQASGNGRIIWLSSPYLFVNARMQPQKEDDGRALSNATVALRLLEGFDQVWVIGEDDTVIDPTKEESLVEVIPDHAWLVFWLLMVAAVLLLWWKGRRLGAPIEEEQPVEIAGSALVSSIGDLRRRKGNATQAANSLRIELRRDLGVRIGLPPNAAVHALIDAIANSTTLSQQELINALCFETESVLVGNQPVYGSYVTEEQELVSLAQKLHQIRTEVLHVPTT